MAFAPVSLCLSLLPNHSALLPGYHPRTLQVCHGVFMQKISFETT